MTKKHPASRPTAQEAYDYFMTIKNNLPLKELQRRIRETDSDGEGLILGLRNDLVFYLSNLQLGPLHQPAEIPSLEPFFPVTGSSST